MKSFFTLFILLVIVNGSYAWYDQRTTHRVITQATLPLFFSAAERQRPVNNKKLEDWLLEGADLEDQGDKIDFVTNKARSFNHFHAPTKPLSEAGLTNLPVYTGQSALIWAQDGAKQATKVGGDWSWQKVRNHYYEYLTATVNPGREVKQSDYLKGIGYQLHLIQDMSQPNHVRNDTHMADGDGKKEKYGFETWAVGHPDKIKNILATEPIPTVTIDLTQPFAEPTLAPVPVARLFDTREHLGGGIITPSTSMNQGLAEYTNTNFFSEDTTFAGGLSTGNSQHFPYPAKSETNLQNYIDKTLDVASMTDVDGRTMSYFKVSKQNTSGTPLSCLAKAGPNTRKYYNEQGEGAAFYRSFRVDDECFEEYSKFLFPRAVAYSKALLDYFFRGTIELSLPAQGVYSLATPNSSGYREIRVKAKNSTTINEEMPNGSLQLVVKYKLALTNPLQSEPFDVGPEQYIVVPEKNNVRTLSRTTPRELVFDLSAYPLPFWAVDVYLQVVYRGQLGNEADSVAVGLRDISEPTPIDIVNHMDLVCVNNTLLTAGSAAAIAAVDTNADGNADWDIFPHGLTNVYLAFNGAQASSTNRSASFANIPPGSYGRVFLLGDYSGSSAALMVSTAVTVQKLDGRDVWGLAFGSGVDAIDAVDNQNYYAWMYSVRALQSWWYTNYETPAYPANASCDLTVAQPNIAGPVAVSFP